MIRTVFITGTDTSVGKTFVTTALLQALRAKGVIAAGFKPVASGAQPNAEGALRNEDAEQLLAASSPGAAYAEINPYVFAPPIAPHLAARAAGVTIDLRVLDAAHDALAQRYDQVVVEGAGGWQVPLDDRRTFADWVAARGWPVVLVVAIRLGALNHALLSAESIARRTRLLGWVANRLPGTTEGAAGEQAANVEDLRERLSAQFSAPLLANVEAGARRADLAAQLAAHALFSPENVS